MQATVLLTVACMLGGAPWKTFNPVGAGFEVQVPVLPSEKRQPIRTTQGNGELRFYSLNHKTGSFAVSVADFPAAAVPAGKDEYRLDQARDGAIQQAKGRLRWEKKVLVDGSPGRDLYIATDAGHAVRMRLAADGNRLFQIMATGEPAFLDMPETMRFLDSFKRRK
jgi:hypothetical protein